MEIKIVDLFKCFVVAEAGSNHNGQLKLGKRLIEKAKKCGCDAIKFQAFKTKNLVTEKAKKAEYQKGKSLGKSQFEMLKALELSEKEHLALVKHAEVVGIPIFYSVFDKDSADMVESLGIEIFKLGSGELTNIPLIKHIAQKNKPLIISTGMGSDEEIADAVDAFKEKGDGQLLLMNCSSGYPSKLEEANLKRIKFIKTKFGVPCGNSDHTRGLIVSVAAAALGTPFIEKHFTVDRNLPGPDHLMSMDPMQMKKMCNIIRIVEKNPITEQELRKALTQVCINITEEEFRKIMGREDRKLSEREKNQRIWARKSVVASRNIKKGDILTIQNTAIKRPEEGILPKYYEKVMGRKTKCNIKDGTPIKWSMLE